jgi:hypothetical protein
MIAEVEKSQSSLRKEAEDKVEELINQTLGPEIYLKFFGPFWKLVTFGKNKRGLAGILYGCPKYSEKEIGTFFPPVSKDGTYNPIEIQLLRSEHKEKIMEFAEQYKTSFGKEAKVIDLRNL